VLRRDVALGPAVDAIDRDDARRAGDRAGTEVAAVFVARVVQTLAVVRLPLHEAPASQRGSSVVDIDDARRALRGIRLPGPVLEPEFALEPADDLQGARVDEAAA